MTRGLGKVTPRSPEKGSRGITANSERHRRVNEGGAESSCFLSTEHLPFAFSLSSPRIHAEICGTHQTHGTPRLREDIAGDGQAVGRRGQPQSDQRKGWVLLRRRATLPNQTSGGFQASKTQPSREAKSVDPGHRRKSKDIVHAWPLQPGLAPHAGLFGHIRTQRAISGNIIIVLCKGSRQYIIL